MVQSTTAGIDHYGVMGNPIAHSKSPQIHHLFAEQTAQQLAYEAILVPLGGFATAVANFHEAGGQGLNVTVPFKLEAWQLSDERSPGAERAGAVNTLVLRKDGSLFGDNTDGIGLVRDLTQNHHTELKGQRLLLIGAGGAARGVLEPLLAQSPAQLTIANRTTDKALKLAQDFADLGVIKGCGFDKLHNKTFDIVINATAAGLNQTVPDIPEECVRTAHCCYDMMYAEEPTAFVHWARQSGAAKAIDGLGMLVEQAAESFFIWRGIRPNTGQVIKALRP